MNTRKIALGFAITGSLLAGVLASGAAQARDGADVQWSVTIGSPRVHLPGGGVVWLPPIPVPRAVVVHTPPRQVVYAPHGGWNTDHDDVPVRHDRVYSPRWDRDGDGIPNRYDQSPRGGQYGQVHRDYRDERRDDWRDDRRDHRRDRHGR